MPLAICDYLRKKGASLKSEALGEKINCRLGRPHETRENHKDHSRGSSPALRSPAQRRKVRSGPRPANRDAPKRHCGHSTSSHSPANRGGQVPTVSLQPPPGARSSRPTPHAPPPSRVRAILLSVMPLATSHLVAMAPAARRASRQPTAWPSARAACAGAAHTRRPRPDQSISLFERAGERFPAQLRR